MPLFTIYNIGLGCAQKGVCEVSAQNTQHIIYYNSWKIIFGVFLKRADLDYMALNANELHIPAPSPEEGVAYTSLSALHIYSNEQPE